MTASPNENLGDPPLAIESIQAPPRGLPLRVFDLCSIVIGYGLAALLLRVVLPDIQSARAIQIALAGIVFLWLGLAMSGPPILLLERRDRRQASRRTGAEWAWVLIGGYWIALAALVVPSQLEVTPLLGAIPFTAALLYWLVGPRPDPGASVGPTWTHRAAVGVLATWPLAWGALITLSFWMT